ncbi:hypothetical protein D3C71_1911950 [compost metagenome]
MWYCVAVPSRYQGWLLRLSPGTAPVTGVPALPTVPADTRRVGKVSGWPSLSVLLKLRNQDQSPFLLPTDALTCLPA